MSPRHLPSGTVTETPIRLLRTRHIIELTGLSRMTIHRMERRGEFPQRRRVGAHTVAWLDTEIVAWMESRPSAAAAPTRTTPRRPGRPRSAPIDA